MFRLELTKLKNNLGKYILSNTYLSKYLVMKMLLFLYASGTPSILFEIKFNFATFISNEIPPNYK